MGADQLQRFLTAQGGGVHERALAELQAGSKRSHWMWFVFPQIVGLGRSANAQHYAIADRAEAEAYLAHPVLGPRLLDCTQALLDLDGNDPVAVMGTIDAQKLRSSMTLFEAVSPGEPRFRTVLERYYGGESDEATLRRL